MKHLKKRIFSLILAVTILSVSVFCAAASTVYEFDNFSFEVQTDDTLLLSGYSGTYLSVPAFYLNKPVVGIKYYAVMNGYVSALSFESAYNLTNIGMYAFAYCTDLKDVYLPSRITTVGMGAFRGCSSLETAEFLANQHQIPNSTFRDCSSLKNVVLDSELTSIGTYAFAGCSSLEYLDIPETVESIGRNAFESCENLVLGVYTDSYAHQYAIENSIPYILIDEPKLGDVNMDGEIDILDALMVQKYAGEKIELTDEEFKLADVNNDGYADVLDATKIQKHAVGKIVIETPTHVFY